MGRDRNASPSKGPRKIDIDILLFGDQIIDEPGLKVPHPAMHKRRFVLAPLAEIDAEAIHPVLERSVGEFLDELPRMLESFGRCDIDASTPGASAALRRLTVFHFRLVLPRFTQVQFPPLVLHI